MLDPQFEAMSVDERLQLIEALYESIAKSPEALTLSSEQEAELDRRMDDIEKNPQNAIPYEEVRQRYLRK